MARAATHLPRKRGYALITARAPVRAPRDLACAATHRRAWGATPGKKSSLPGFLRKKAGGFHCYFRS